MKKQAPLISLPFFILFLYDITITLAQSPAQSPSHNPTPTPAQSPTQPGPAQAPTQVPLVQAPPHRALAAPTNVTKILEKAGSYSIFIRLLKSTQVLIQIENQLNVSNTLTIFSPTNSAFSSLKPGTLNSLTTEQKAQLVQYHVLPTFISLSNFQTLSNPVRTQASSTNDFPLNITTEGNWVNISTGLVNTSISGTVYTDNQLAIYKIEKVMLPQGIFAPRPKAKAPAHSPAPTPAKSTVKPDELPSSSLYAPEVSALLNDISSAECLVRNGISGIVGVAVVLAVFVFN
ncbi:hypothetical protein UlMin_013675 [Ulmus minor]